MIKTLGRYELRRVIGRGGAGTVYEALDSVLNRRVAIKVVRVRDDDPAVGELLTRFRQEAQVASRLSHPSVVQVYDYGEVDGEAFIVMEFVEGETLKALLDRGERLPLTRAVEIIGAVLLALDQCHRQDIVHRDIKPANIMLPSEGGIKLADFGIARIENSELTMVGTVMGSPPYMSPEQFTARQPVDFHTDIWSTAIVLYEMLTGMRPFSGSNMAQIGQAVTTDPVRPPSRGSPELPATLDDVLLRALDKLPENRFPSAEAFARALRSALPADDRSQSLSPASASRAGRRALVVLAVTVLAGAGAGGWLWLRPRPVPSGGILSLTQTEPFVHPVTSPEPAPTPASPQSAPTSTSPEPAPTPVSPQSVPTLVSPEPAPTRAEPPPAPLQAEPVPPPTLADLSAQAATIPCSAITVSSGTAPDISRFAGIIGSGPPHAALEAIVASLPSGTGHILAQTFPRTRLSCRLAELVRANGGPSAGVHARLFMPEGGTRLTTGQQIRLRLKMPDFDGEVRLEDLNSDGQFAHLMEANLGSPPRFHAGMTVGLGRNGDDAIGEVSPPYGSDMLVAIVSSEPLLKIRHLEQETGPGFVDKLQAAIAELRLRGGRVAADALILNTAKK